MRHLQISFIISLLFILAACSSRPEFSESVYVASEVGEAKSIIRCRVLSVREITIRDDDANKEGEAIGTLAGGILGAALGGTVGGDANDRQLGAAVGGILGAVGGGLAGEAIGEERGTRKGLEYSVLTADGEEVTFAQEFLQGDRISPEGSTCRMQISGSKRRILPADYLPDEVERPEETTFSN